MVYWSLAVQICATDWAVIVVFALVRTIQSPTLYSACGSARRAGVLPGIPAAGSERPCHPSSVKEFFSTLLKFLFSGGRLVFLVILSIVTVSVSSFAAPLLRTGGYSKPQPVQGPFRAAAGRNPAPSYVQHFSPFLCFSYPPAIFTLLCV